MSKYAASWSGGKDSCFACWKAMEQGLKASYLLNILEANSTRSMSHGLKHDLVALQAEALGLPIIQQVATWESYEDKFKIALEQLRLKGISGLITGDIYLQEHKDWTDRVCTKAGLETILPLWQMNTSQLLRDFIKAGFKAIIVGAKAEFFNKSWLGRPVNNELAADLQKLASKINIDPCGEHGEFHTFVYDGPLFHKPIYIGKTETTTTDGYMFLDIMEYKLG